jgi:hypothetical protein
MAVRLARAKSRGGLDQVVDLFVDRADQSVGEPPLVTVDAVGRHGEMEVQRAQVRPEQVRAGFARKALADDPP